eukprot:CAMPEP_0194198456 /NCGR_PEP_ID=MMETSP0154-20130528/77777_1 /TAXON_ID=1049557 /ORGANISM="Thalassiothrix antarctica, Strain L6-D1" /LENGTH=210 /DNA_ID=CAMNT_0038923253 /DNA_START=678 /DNA_END=1310 /DNA_ORIENTATION=-
MKEKKNPQNIVILNCASQEYIQVLDRSKLQTEYNILVLDIVFQAAEGGDAKRKTLASVYAKQARGMFVRFIAKTNPQTIEDLQSFTGDGHYVFSSSSSSSLEKGVLTITAAKKKSIKKQLVFERYPKVQGPGDDEKKTKKDVNKKNKTVVSSQKESNDDNQYKKEKGTPSKVAQISLLNKKKRSDSTIIDSDNNNINNKRRRSVRRKSSS